MHLRIYATVYYLLNLKLYYTVYAFGLKMIHNICLFMYFVFIVHPSNINTFLSLPTMMAFKKVTILENE